MERQLRTADFNRTEFRICRPEGGVEQKAYDEVLTRPY